MNISCHPQLRTGDYAYYNFYSYHKWSLTFMNPKLVGTKIEISNCILLKYEIILEVIWVIWVSSVEITVTVIIQYLWEDVWSRRVTRLDIAWEKNVSILK